LNNINLVSTFHEYYFLNDEFTILQNIVFTKTNYTTKVISGMMAAISSVPAWMHRVDITSVNHCM